MAATLPKRRGRSASARGLAIVFSALVHLVIVAGLLWQMRGRDADDTAGAMQVELLRAPTAHERANDKLPPRSHKPAAPTPSSPPQMARAVVAPALPTPTASPLPAAPPEMSKALRHSLGCAHADFFGMTPSEREDCQLRAARLAGAGKPGPQFGLPPQEQAAFDAEAKRSNLLQEPFLAERPKKGCKPTVTEHESGVVGRSAPNWTAGVACTFRF